MGTLILPIATQLLAVLLLFIYFSKKRLNTKENKIYSKMLIINFVYALMAIITFLYAKIYGDDFVISIMQKIYMSLMLLLIINILIYNISILNIKDSIRKSLNMIIRFSSVLLVIVVFITPLHVINKGDILDGYGLSYDIVLGATVLYFILIIISIIVIFIKNKSGFTKDIPFICLIVLYIAGLLIRDSYPSIMFENYLFTFMLFIMYFTIENPDLKVVNELLRNKELMEQGMDDKSRFLFETSQEIKTPTKNIIEITKKFDKLDDGIDKKDAVRLISVNANNILFRLNNILDISSMDANKIKIKEDYYNTTIFFNEIKGLTQNAIKDKNIILDFKVSDNVPSSLNGDDVKFKQVLMSVILDCIENTDDGYIRIYIDSIVRYDVARIIINIEDTGIGMSIEKINDILDDRTELTDNDKKKLDKLDVDLKATIKIIKLLGGSFNIKSEEKKGTTFTIVIDQKCKIEESSKIMKNIEKYSSDVYGRKRVLVVDDSKEELFVISDILGKYNVDINTTMSGKDCVDRIKGGEFYNLIIIDDELKNNSALSVLQKLKEIKKFKVPVVVMLEKDKEHFKKYYLDDSFSDIVLKANITEEIERVIAKFL